MRFRAKRSALLQSGLRSEIVQLRDLDREERCLFRNLLADYVSSQVSFLTLDFALACSRVLTGALIARVFDENGVRMYIPFQKESSPFHLTRHATKVGGHLSDRFSPAGPALPSAQLLVLADLLKVDTFRFDHYAGSDPREGGGDEKITSGKIIRIDRGAEDYWASMKKHNPDFLRKIKKRIRGLAQQSGELRLDLNVYDHRALDQIIEHKRSQYKATGVADALQEQWTRALLHELLDLRDSEDLCPLLSVLYAGDKWVASHFGLLGPASESGRVLSYWFAVYNKEFRAFGPGHILKYFIINAAHEADVNEIDLGEGENLHKLEYLTSDYGLSQGLSLASSWRGFAGRCEHAAHWRLRGKF
ncbi:GNAT family N-acetyltransferase [Falsiroseomonas sp.]|uniref:GNAT family N-acetyltransferase n=1 Tax=Falsiroseomonas sp. TaxID=2870721 RepID=UPI003562FE25